MKSNLGSKETSKDNRITKSETNATLSVQNTALKFIAVASPIKSSKNNSLGCLQKVDVSTAVTSQLTSAIVPSVSHLINIPTSASLNNNATSSLNNFGASQSIFTVNKNINNENIYLSQKHHISTTINTSLQNTLLISQSGGSINPTIVSYNLVNRPILNCNNTTLNNNIISQTMTQQSNISTNSQTYYIASGLTSSASIIKSVANSNLQSNILALGINSNPGQNNSKQLATSSSSGIYISASLSNVTSASNASNIVNSSHIALVNTQGTLLRANTRHILACNVANRNQCLITTAVPMRALRIQSPLNHANRFTTVNAGINVNQAAALEQANQIIASDRPLKLANNLSKVEVARSNNPRAMNAMSVQNRPFVAQTIRLSNSAVARLPIRPVEIKQSFNADESGKVLLLSGDNLDSRISGRSIVNFDNKILVSTAQNIFNFDGKLIGGQIINTEGKSDTKLSEVKQLIQVNADLKSASQNVVHFEGGKILTGQNVINLGDGTLLTDQMMSRVINQASSGEGGMIVVSQNIGQQFTALQNKGMVVSGLKLPAYIDLRQVSTANDYNPRTKTVTPKNNRPTFNPCSNNRSKDTNARSQMNEKDSQELERVMDILKHYKQQISCHDQVTAHFLQPCKRKRSKPGESMVGALATTNSSCHSDNNYNSLQTSNIANHLDNNLSNLKTTQLTLNHSKLYSNSSNTTASLTYNANSIMASLSSGFLNTSLNNDILGSSINNGLLEMSLISNLTGSGGGLLRAQTEKAGETPIGVGRSFISPRLLAFRPSLVSLLQQPIAKIFSLEETSLKADELLSKSNLESKENLSNNIEIKDHLINNDFLSINDDHMIIDDDPDDVDMIYDDHIVRNIICKEHGMEIIKEFILKSFNLESDEDIKICVIVKCDTNLQQKHNLELKKKENSQHVKISSEKIICFLEEINCVDGSCQQVEKCNCLTSLSLFGLLITKDLNFELNIDAKDIFNQFDCSFGNSDNINYNLFENSLKKQAEIISSKLYGNNYEKWSNVTFSKQQIIDDQNCYILSINKLNSVQYLTIPNYTLTYPEFCKNDNAITNKDAAINIDIAYSNKDSAINNKELAHNISVSMKQEILENGFISNKKDDDDCAKIDISQIATMKADNKLDVNKVNIDIKEITKSMCVNYISNELHENSLNKNLNVSGDKKVTLSCNKIVTRASKNVGKANDKKEKSTDCDSA